MSHAVSPRDPWGWHGPFSSFATCDSALDIAILFFHPAQVDYCSYDPYALKPGWYYAIA